MIETFACEETVLKVQGLYVNRSNKPVLKDINLEIRCGEFVGLVGPNGSGKSTLLMAILGILHSQAGSIEIYSQPPSSNKTLGKVGWVSQAAASLPPHMRLTVRELVRLGTLNKKNLFWRKKISNARVERAIEMVGLSHVADVDVSRLSGGQRQRAVIGRVLASEAEFILLDEPLVGIDRESRNSLLQLLDKLCHEQNKTIFMVSHDLAAIRQTTHRMIYLEESIQFDGPSDQFPDLTGLADLRGIKHVHGHDEFDHHNHHHHHHSHEKKEEE
jgi:zinc transport system ATP-binding protein